VTLDLDQLIFQTVIVCTARALMTDDFIKRLMMDWNNSIHGELSVCL